MNRIIIYRISSLFLLLITLVINGYFVATDPSISILVIIVSLVSLAFGYCYGVVIELNKQSKSV